MQVSKSSAAARSSGPSGGSGGGTGSTTNYVRRGHEITTVRKTETTTTRNRRGHPVVKTKTHTVYYVDGKAVKLNWFDRLRIRFMSTYEKQAFLAEKLLKQEKKQRTTTTTTTSGGGGHR